MSSLYHHAEQVAMIPSTDGITLEARIGTPSSSSTTRKDVCVIVTHPYGSLGGNLHNNVVEAVVRAFGRDFITARFNFRGVGQSSGRGTFGGKGEAEDLLSVWRYVRDRVDLKPRFFLLVGYSYGCIPISSSCLEIEGCIGIATISFPVSVMWLLTMGNSAKYLDSLREFPESLPKLFIIGSKDNFTSIKNFGQMVMTMPERRHVEVVEGVDHFWGGQEQVVVDAIRKWIRVENVVPDKLKGVPLPPLESLRDARKAQSPVRLRGAQSVEALDSAPRVGSEGSARVGRSMDQLAGSRDTSPVGKSRGAAVADSKSTLHNQ
ncbi:Alpha/Beta hydrolase protein [Obelidium mucronatum]|nr:Alpha/Beta hydrolase protein [Obelidium mucronatum]